MARDVTAGVQAELGAKIKHPVIFYEGDFNAGTVRLWSGLGTVTWNGQSWQGAGTLLAVSTVAETADLRAEGVTVTLSGLSPTIVALALAEARLGRPGRVWLGFLDEDDSIIADPYLAFEGKLDVPSIDYGAESVSVSITYENNLIDLERPRVFRWTHDTQQLFAPGSLGFIYAAQQADIKIVY